MSLVGVGSATPSWVNRLIARVDALPGPWSAWYAAIGAIGIVGANVSLWQVGIQATGTFSVTQSYYGILPVVLVLSLRYLDGAARAAARTFRPAMDLTDEAFGRLIDELTVIPARPAVVVTIAMTVLTAMGFLGDPKGSGVAALPPVSLALRFISESLVSTLFLLVALHTLRQLRAVTRIHALATRIDLLRPAPIHAFSGLTMRTSLVIVGLLLSSLAADTDGWRNASPWVTVPWFGGGMMIAMAAFVLPMRGMHDRIVAAKRSLQDANATRLLTVTASLHTAVDTDDLPRADGLNKLLASLVLERDLVGRLATWPWQPGQIGAVASAILLPILLFLVTRWLGAITL